MTTAEIIRERLKEVKYPGFSRDIISFDIVKNIQVTDGVADIEIHLSTDNKDTLGAIQSSCEQALESLSDIRSFNIRFQTQPAPHQHGTQGFATNHSVIPGVKQVIAVASGKGGVGKSTVAANLACALAKQGLSVGLCDCDIYGPSIALMFGTSENPLATEDNRIIPIERHGIKLMSMGFLLEGDSPAILRGPMVTRFTQQFLRDVEWGDLDVLVLDLPPGTGDIQLTIVQTVALAGAVVVTTPQEVALIDARKAVAMFHKVNVPILGIVENMSHFLCPSDGKRYDIFGEGGGRREAARLGVPLLAEVPIEIPTRECGDRGKPVVLAHPTTPAAQSFLKAAALVSEAIKS